MSSFGRNTITGGSGNRIMITADGKPEWKHGGVTIDWTTVAALGADTVVDGRTISSGDKYIRYGTPLTTVKTSEVQTVTLTAATGGTFTLTLSGQTTGAIAYNAAASAVQTAIAALSNVGSGNVVVTGSDGGPYTVTFSNSLGNLATMTATDSTTGTGHGVAVASVSDTGGPNSVGKYGPIDTSVTDGRQTATRGTVYLLNETVVKSDERSDHPAVLEGGLVWRDRLNIAGSNQITEANLLVAMPRLRLVRETN
jgi:hypothetical protein